MVKWVSGGGQAGEYACVLQRILSATRPGADVHIDMRSCLIPFRSRFLLLTPLLLAFF